MYRGGKLLCCAIECHLCFRSGIPWDKLNSEVWVVSMISLQEYQPASSLTEDSIEYNSILCHQKNIVFLRLCKQESDYTYITV